MTFSEYLNILYPFFDWEQVQRKIAENAEALNEDDTETEPIFTSNRKSKAKFTKALLISGLKNGTACRKEFLNWTDDYYLKLFRGDKDRSASSVLSRINLETDFDDLAFRDFISEFFEKRFDKIRTEFDKIDIPIAEDDEAERLLEIFKNICAETSGKNNLMIKLLGEDQSQIANIILRLRRVLNDLKGESAAMVLLGVNLGNYLNREQLERNAESNTNDAAQKIKEPSIVDQVFGYMLDDSDSRYESPDTFYNGEHNSVVKPICDKLSELQDINDELAPYIERYPNYRFLRGLYKVGIAIQNVNLFLRDPKWTDARTYDPIIDQYEKLLIECSRNIVNPTAAFPTDL